MEPIHQCSSDCLRYNNKQQSTTTKLPYRHSRLRHGAYLLDRHQEARKHGMRRMYQLTATSQLLGKTFDVPSSKPSLHWILGYVGLVSVLPGASSSTGLVSPCIMMSLMPRYFVNASYSCC